MATAESVAAKLQALITAANATTGKTDTDLTTAVDSLISGFGGGSGLHYDIGEIVLDADTFRKDDIPHHLGEAPGFVLVWSDEMTQYTQENPNSAGKAVNAGYFWADGLFGIPQRLTATIENNNGLFVAFAISNDDYRLNAYIPTSLTYTEIQSSYETISLPLLAARGSASWFAGITYKYFVSPKWWTTGQGG